MGSIQNSSTRATIQIINQMLEDSPLFVERIPYDIELRDETRESELTEAAQQLYIESPSPHNIAYINDDSAGKFDSLFQESSFVLSIDQDENRMNEDQLSPSKMPREVISPLSCTVLN